MHKNVMLEYPVGLVSCVVSSTVNETAYRLAATHAPPTSTRPGDENSASNVNLQDFLFLLVYCCYVVYSIGILLPLITSNEHEFRMKFWFTFKLEFLIK